MSVEKSIKKLSSGVRTPSNITLGYNPVETEKILIEVKPDYIEILGHRIEGFESWEAFLEYIKHLAALEDENKALQEEIDILHNNRADLMIYLATKIEETKLMRTYQGGVCYPSIQERVYEEIYNKVDGGKNV